MNLSLILKNVIIGEGVIVKSAIIGEGVEAWPIGAWEMTL